MTTKAWGICVFLSVFALAPACVNDSDTIATEAKGLPEVVDVIAGRFDRNPDLYYQMRLERVAKQLGDDPSRLGDYDDAAACCDRLGDDEAAIEWMDKKWAQMSRMDLPSDSQHPYRYYANIGTFRAHKWLNRGAKSEEIHLLKSAYDEIKQAVTINPDAHFGREWVQLELMARLLFDTLDPSKVKQMRPEHDALVASHMSSDAKEHASQMIEGITGIIVLGKGWESSKVWEELALWLQMHRDERLSELAMLRAREVEGKSTFDDRDSNNAKAFSALRANGDQYVANRHKFMLAKLEKGVHPDTDSDFWNGYQETPPVDLAPYSPKRGLPLGLGTGVRMLMVAGGLVVLVTVFLIRVGRKSGRATGV